LWLFELDKIAMAIRNDIEHETTELSHRQVLARLGLVASVAAYVAPALFTLREAKASGGGSGVSCSGSANAGTGGTGGGTPPAATPIIAP
jgi:hypothetical protein